MSHRKKQPAGKPFLSVPVDLALKSRVERLADLIDRPQAYIARKMIERELKRWEEAGGEPA